MIPKVLFASGYNSVNASLGFLSWLLQTGRVEPLPFTEKVHPSTTKADVTKPNPKRCHDFHSDVSKYI